MPNKCTIRTEGPCLEGKGEIQAMKKNIGKQNFHKEEIQKL